MADNTDVTLVALIQEYLEKRNLPYRVINSNMIREPKAGIFGTNIWLGWIYETQFKSYNHRSGVPDGLIKLLDASDPDFFAKLEAWLPECDAMWEAYPDSPTFAVKGRT